MRITGSVGCVCAAALVVLAASGNAWATIVYDASIDQALYGHIDQANVPLNPGGGGQNSCVPTAVMNSFIYLQNRFPSLYGTTLTGANATTAASDLGNNYMGSTSTNGTSANGWIDGKIRYVNEKAPGTTIFAGQSSVYTGANASVAKIDPTIAFLLAELQHGEDIEIGIVPVTGGIGHALTLTSLHWEDVDEDGTFNGDDAATIDGIDPAHGVAFVKTLFPGANIGVDYIPGGNARDYNLVLAITESAVPEPLTMLGLFLGLGSVGNYIRSRRMN